MSFLSTLLILVCICTFMPGSVKNAEASSTKNTLIVIETSKGEISLQLDDEKAPETCANFIRYVEEGFYENTIFHRVIKNFMIQGGGMTTDLKEKEAHESIKNEADNGLKNDKYTVSMARTRDPHSASAQFFINTKNNDFLNFTSASVNGYGYAVFGKVIDGQDVVDAIEAVKTGNNGFHQDVPTEPVMIISARVVRKADK